MLRLLRSAFEQAIASVGCRRPPPSRDRAGQNDRRLAESRRFSERGHVGAAQRCRSCARDAARDARGRATGTACSVAPAGANGASSPAASLLASMPSTIVARPSRRASAASARRRRARRRDCARRRARAALPGGSRSVERARRRAVAAAPAIALVLGRGAIGVGRDRRARVWCRSIAIASAGLSRLVRAGERGSGGRDRAARHRGSAAGRVGRRSPSRRPRARTGAPARRATSAIRARDRRGIAHRDERHAGLAIPAFSRRDLLDACRRGTLWWSMPSCAMPVTSGRATTLVASSRPPSPTSTMQASAGVRAKARKAAAVVTSKKLAPMPSRRVEHLVEQRRRARRRRSACRRGGCAR